MGRIPPIAIMIIGVVLIVGVSAGVFFMLIKPQQETLAQLQSNLEKEQAEAAQLDSVEEELARVDKKWDRLQDKLAAAQDERSIPISFTQPITAMITLWPEYRQTLPELIEEFVDASGCTLISGVSFPAPPNVPPSAPPTGFIQITGGHQISITVEGSLASIEKLYKSLRNFPRVVIVSSLSLSGEGDTITAQVPLSIYLLVEVPPAAAAPAVGAGAYGMPGMGGMPGMPGMGLPGGMPGAAPGAAPIGPPGRSGRGPGMAGAPGGAP